MRRRGWFGGCLLVAAALLVHAEGRASLEEDPPEVSSTPTTYASPSSFAGMFGLAAVQRDVKSADASVRAAAVARAAELGTDEGWRIVEAAAGDNRGGDIDGALRVRLAAARALAFDPRKSSATAALRPLTSKSLPVLMSPILVPPPMGFPPMPMPFPPTPAPPKPVQRADGDLFLLLRETAALALAIQGDFDRLLVEARSHDDVDTARAALTALTAYPPPSLSSLLARVDKGVQRDTVELLAKLDDLRAADALLGVARGKDDYAAALALDALGRLGDGRAAVVAKGVGTGSDWRLRLAAAGVLVELGESAGDSMIAALLSDKKAGEAARRLAIQYPSAPVMPALAKLALAGDASAAAALGRLGAAGIPALRAIAQDESAPAAAIDAAVFALATMPGSDARAALAALLPADASTPARALQQRRVVRAGAVRLARLDDASSSIESRAEALLDSKVDADRFVGALYAGVDSLGAAKKLLSSDDPIRRRAAAVALGAHDVGDAAAIARARLAATISTEDPMVLRALVAVAARAVDGTPQTDVPITTSMLATWLAQDSDVSALAAFLLGARGGDVARPLVVRALAADDLAVRAAAMLGLALSPDASATGELGARYAELVVPSLRKAVVRALVARGDAAARRTLELARKLDPDPDIRALAARAVLLPGVHPKTPLARGVEVLQTTVVVAPGTTVDAMLVTVDGFAAPVLVDPDGAVVAFRVPGGEARFEARPSVLAAAPPSAKTPKP